MGKLNDDVHVPRSALSWTNVNTWKNLNSVCEGVFDCPHTTPKLTETGPFVVRSQDIRTGIFRTDLAARVSESTYIERIERAEPREGDLLFSREGTYFGIAAEVPARVRVCLGQRMVLIRPNDKLLNSTFLRYWINSPLMAGHIAGFKDGSVAERLNMPTIRGLPVPLLDRKAQDSIAGTLLAFDQKIELHRRMNETLEAQARALFRDWFVDFGPVRAKMAGEAPYLVPDLWSLFPNRLDGGCVPEGWKLAPLTAHFDIIGGGTPKTSIVEYWNGPIPWFSVVDTPSASDVFVFETEKTITPEAVANSSARIVRAGTTIISARGTVGNLAMAAQDMTFNQSCYALQGLSGASDAFVYLAAQHMVDRLRSMAHGSVFSTITRKTFESLSLVYPGKALHEAFHERVSPLFAKIRANVAENLTLAQTRDLLLPKLMSGEIRVQEST